MPDLITRAQNLESKRSRPAPWKPGPMGSILDSLGNRLVHDTDGNMCKHDAALAAFAPEAAAALAAEQWEYGVEYTGVNHGNRHTSWLSNGYPTSKDAAELEYKEMARCGMNPKMVKRRVSPQEDA